MVGAPVLLEAPEAVSLPMGETATFTCRGRGEPTPTVSWTRDGAPVEGGETVRGHLTTQTFITHCIEDNSLLYSHVG